MLGQHFFTNGWLAGAPTGNRVGSAASSDAAGVYRLLRAWEQVKDAA